jgi:hypothetical protein
MDGRFTAITGSDELAAGAPANGRRGRRASATVAVENVMASSVIHLAILTIH